MSWRDFFRGVGSVVDLFGVSAPQVDRPKDDDAAFRRDAEAIRGDWEAVARGFSAFGEALRASGFSVKTDSARASEIARRHG